MPDDVAARTASTRSARGSLRDGKWAEAREVFGLLASRYPGHPLAVEGFRWLTRYHASTEARRRTEIQQKLLLKNVSFDALPGADKVIAGQRHRVSGDAADASTRTSTAFHSPDMIMKWHQACLDLEPKLAAFGPVHSRDPAAWLCFLAARRQVGKHADADTFVRDYFKHTPGAAAMAPGVDPWRDCLAAELWLTDRNAMPVPPKPLGVCQRPDLRPLLDGKLDDACWQDAKPLALKVAAADRERGRREGVRQTVTRPRPGSPTTSSSCTSR